MVSINPHKSSATPRKPQLVTRGIVQLLPVNLGVIPALRRLIDIEMAWYIIAIGAMIRDQNLNLLGTGLGCRSTWCSRKVESR